MRAVDLPFAGRESFRAGKGSEWKCDEIAARRTMEQLYLSHLLSVASAPKLPRIWKCGSKELGRIIYEYTLLAPGRGLAQVLIPFNSRM